MDSRVAGWTETSLRLTFLMGAAGHQGAVGPLTLCPVGAHLHFVVAIGIQVGELHRGYLAVQQVGFRLRVALDPVLHLWAGAQWEAASAGIPFVYERLAPPSKARGRARGLPGRGKTPFQQGEEA